MNQEHDTIELHSEGGRLYVHPADIISSAKGKQLLARFKKSSIYQSIKQRGGKPSGAA